MRCSCPWCGNDAVEGCESLMGEPACAAHDYSEIGKQDVLKPVGTPSVMSRACLLYIEKDMFDDLQDDLMEFDNDER